MLPPGLRPDEPPPRLGLLELAVGAITLTVIEGDPRDRRRFTVIEELHLPTGLRRHHSTDGALCEAGQQQALDALRHVARRLDALGIGHDALLATTTAGLRDAPNGPDFLRRVEQSCALKPTIVSDAEEAELLGAAQERCFPQLLPLLLVAIGERRTKIACRERGSTRWALSLPVGSTELAGRLGSDVVALRAAAQEAMSELPPVRSGRPLVGVAGAVTEIAQVLRADPFWDGSLHGSLLRTGAIQAAIERLGAMRAEQRRQVMGLRADRSEQIVAGMCVLEALCERTHSSELHVSDRGLRFGLLWSRWRRASVE